MSPCRVPPTASPRKPEKEEATFKSVANFVDVADVTAVTNGLKLNTTVARQALPVARMKMEPLR